MNSSKSFARSAERMSGPSTDPLRPSRKYIAFNGSALFQKVRSWGSNCRYRLVQIGSLGAIRGKDDSVPKRARTEGSHKRKWGCAGRMWKVSLHSFRATISSARTGYPNREKAAAVVDFPAPPRPMKAIDCPDRSSTALACKHTIPRKRRTNPMMGPDMYGAVSSIPRGSGQLAHTWDPSPSTTNSVPSS